MRAVIIAAGLLLCMTACATVQAQKPRTASQAKPVSGTRYHYQAPKFKVMLPVTEPIPTTSFTGHSYRINFDSGRHSLLAYPFYGGLRPLKTH